MGAASPAERHTLLVGETGIVSCSFVPYLDSGETLTGTPTAAEQTTSDLTITSVSINSATITVSHKSVSANQAVQFKVSGQTAANAPYDVHVTCGTSAGQTRILSVPIDVETP